MPRIKPLPERKKRVLCSNLDSIRDAALKLMSRHPTGTESNDMAASIYVAVTLCKKQALAMEKRLYLYKETIEGLGFKRVRK